MATASNLIHIGPAPNGAPLVMPWKRAIAMGRAFELLRADGLAHLRFVQRDIGFEYCRFHGLFHDEMAVAARMPGGRVFYQWHQVDKVLDALREIGLRPFVELGPMPIALASGSQTIFMWKMNVTPPRVWQEWADLVGAFVRHVVDRYGLDEVRRWYFEVWNEPNLDAFWSGTQEDYWQLYRHAADAVKGVDAQLRVGGPATAQASWIEEFLRFSRETQTPVDFVTTHSYPQDEFVLFPQGKSTSASGDYLKDVYTRVRDTVRAFDPQMELHWTEWNPLSAKADGEVDWSANPSVDNAYGGAFVARHCVEADGLCESMAFWTASDIFEELGLPHAPYSSTYGLLTIHGIPKATFHALAMVKQMEGTRLGVTFSQPSPAGCGLVATRASGSVRVLLWNAPRPGDPEAAAWNGSLSLPNPFPCAMVIDTRLGAGSGSAYETWMEMGRPHNLSPLEEKLLRTHAQPSMSFRLMTEAAETVEMPFTLGVDEVLSIDISEAGESGPSKGAMHADLALWDAGMGSAAQAPNAG